MVTIHCGHGLDTCLVFLAEHPPQGACCTFVQAMSMATNVHEEGGTERVFEGLSSRSLDSAAEAWDLWSWENVEENHTEVEKG